MKLTVYHDGQYWVGVIEEQQENRLRAQRVIFGGEPKDEEILEFVKKELLRLISKAKFRVFLEQKEKKVNPKRLARLVSKEMKQKGISSFAQEAIKQELEARKKEKQKSIRELRKEIEERKWQLKVLKKKQKHRGR